MRNLLSKLLFSAAAAVMLGVASGEARADGIVFQGPDPCFPAGVGRGRGSERVTHVLSLQSQGSSTSASGAGAAHSGPLFICPCLTRSLFGVASCSRVSRNGERLPAPSLRGRPSPRLPALSKLPRRAHITSLPPICSTCSLGCASAQLGELAARSKPCLMNASARSASNGFENR